MRIDVISDTVCPWCFIGKRRLEQALEMSADAAGVEIAWRPYQLNPDMPSAGMDRRVYLQAKFGGGARAERQYGVIGRTGREHGIEFRFDLIRRTPNTVSSHRLIHFAGGYGRQDAVVEALFRAYFTEGRDIGSLATLAGIAAAVGLDRDVAEGYLRSERDADLVLREDSRVRALGVSGVPCFVIEGKYAVSGAQSAEIFQQIFALVREDETLSPAAAAE